MFQFLIEHFVKDYEDVEKISVRTAYGVLDCVFCPFLVALMHFNSADKLVENGGGKVGKGVIAFRQLQKLLRPSARVFKSG